MVQDGNTSPTTYKDAGVDIEAGNALVKAIGPLVKSTARAGSNPDLGGFGGLFDLKACGFADPVLVAANDGVGTKLKLAFETGKHDTIGIDLVAMCVNDLVVQGAEPLFFLDYFATGKLEPGVAETVISGIAEGCRQAGCALIGGETAEMPGMYGENEYDLAGFSVGAAERGALLPKADIKPGDLVIEMPSSGVHSNGFSLIRKLIDQLGLSFSDEAPFEAGVALGEALLRPTKIYVPPCLDLVKKNQVKAFAHITGGGLNENIPRILPDGLGVELSATAWKFPPVMSWLKRTAGLRDTQMASTFNCGIGMIAIVDEMEADYVLHGLEKHGHEAAMIGNVVVAREDERVMIRGTQTQWHD